MTKEAKETKEDFFSSYLAYVGESESPVIYHRWSILSAVGAMLGRQVWIPFGHQKIYPNQYILLMGTAGARKSSALDIAKTLLKESGYRKFAPAKTSKERLLVEMQNSINLDLAEEELENLVLEAPNELYVCKGEFIDFLGLGDTGFMNLLTDLWDNQDEYDNPKITRKCVKVYKPTLSILGGATPQSIALAIPPEQLEMGFTSRILFIFAEPTSTRITFPELPCRDKKSELIERLTRIKNTMLGELHFENDARPLLDRIYKEFIPIDDSRFSKYSARRFTHLLKLALILAVMEERLVVTKEDCIKANTILYAAERRMSKALGEFGKSRYSNVSNMIIEHLNHSVKPVTINELWRLVAKDLTRVNELGEIVKNLQHAGKIQVVTIKDKQGFMLKQIETKSWSSELLNESYLTIGERSL